MTAERHDVAAPSGTPRRARPAAAVHGGEGGSALVIALIMIAVVAVVLLALLSYTGTSIRASASVRASRQTMYAADGAVEAAIQHVRNNPEIGYSVDENGDPVPSCDFDLPAQGAQPAVHVECEGQTASMRLGEGSVAADQPLYSILTLGRRANQQPNLNNASIFGGEASWFSPEDWFDFGGKGEVGLYYNPALGLFDFGGSPTHAAYLKGGVFSNSTIVASKGSLRIAAEPDGSPGGSFKVRQSCGIPDGGQIIVEPSGTNPNCEVIGYPASGGGYGTDGRGVDPNYPSRIDLQGVPPLRSVPVCDPAKELVKFEPGWYNDAKALSELMRDCDGLDHDGDGKGDGADFWFRPGLYYFDFRNDPGVAAPCSDHPRAHQWCIGQGESNPHIVGGTPLAEDGGEWVENPGIVTETRDITFGTATSSQAVAGTDDFANKDNGRSIDNALTQASFGDRSGVLYRAENSSSSRTLWVDHWANHSLARQIQGGTADGSNSAHASNNGCFWSICGETNNQLWLTNFDATPVRPTESEISQVSYRVRHREAGNLGRIQILRMSLYDGGTYKCSVDLTRSTGTSTRTGDWTSCFTEEMLASGSSPGTARVLYEAKAGGCMGTCDWAGNAGGIDYWVDGVELTVTYKDKAVRTLTLSGPSPTFDNPNVVTVGSATATVSHAEPAGSNPELVVTAPGSPGCALPLPVRSANTADSLSIMSCLGSNQAAALNGVTVAYRAGRGGDTTVLSVDGIKVTVDVVIAQEPERFRFPRGCDPEKPGVQFVFGGDSGIRVMDGTFNLCAGQPPGSPGQAGFTRQRIAYYGIKPLPPLQASSADGGAGVTSTSNALVLQENPTNLYADLHYSCTVTLIPWHPCPGTLASAPLSLEFPGLDAPGYPAFPPNTRIAKVELRAQYDTNGFVTNPMFRIWRPVPGEADRQSCGDDDRFPPSFFASGWDFSAWGDATQAFLDVTHCFEHGGVVDADMLRGFRIDWFARGLCGLGCNYTDQLDGMELYITLEATSPTTQTWLPASGCIVGMPNYVGGGGSFRPSCALLKWNSGGPSFDPDDPSAMVSMEGTFYAPGGVLDLAEYGPYCTNDPEEFEFLLFWHITVCVDDDGNPTYNAWDGLYYPVIDRGVIARHLVIRGLKVEPGYDEPVIGCGPGVCGGLIPNPKLVKFEAEISGDKRLTSWVCYGPVLAAPSDPSDVEILSTGKYCSGDGTGPPKIVRWTVS